jgi:hypothetical protein
MRLNALCAALLVSSAALVVGCGPVDEKEATEAERPGEDTGERRPLAPEELARLVEEASARQAEETVTAFTCPAPQSCGAEFNSCSNWSAYSGCGTSTCDAWASSCAYCEYNPRGQPIYCEYTGRSTGVIYRHRTCFNVYGASCTAIETAQSSACGCNN